MVVSQVGGVLTPDLLVSLLALVVVLFVARLLLRVAWRVALLALVVAGVFWATGTTDLLPTVAAFLG